MPSHGTDVDLSTQAGWSRVLGFFLDAAAEAVDTETTLTVDPPPYESDSVPMLMVGFFAQVERAILDELRTGIQEAHAHTNGQVPTDVDPFTTGRSASTDPTAIPGITPHDATGPDSGPVFEYVNGHTNLLTLTPDTAGDGSYTLHSPPVIARARHLYNHAPGKDWYDQLVYQSGLAGPVCEAHAQAVAALTPGTAGITLTPPQRS